LLEVFHALGKRVAQALHDLEQREVHIAYPSSRYVAAAIVLQELLEIAEIFRNALVPEFLGALLRRRLLVLVVKRGTERMVGVVDSTHEIGDGRLQLMYPKFSRLRLRREPVSRAEIEQDVGGLPDHEFSGFQKRRGEGRRRTLPHHLRHCPRSAAPTRDIDIG